ncbi:PadR family transcriptional regulator [Clostridium tetani]|uniref:PadR family transcriptional regulator n=1 Tax=Clostridium tetani TaxID=1513 RepID=UPI00100BFA16|nr:PadR family transcriptional regulator [Clostridium tetani]RXI42120.1 PadR family transcriptional regulator [Clostridium tetani]
MARKDSIDIGELTDSAFYILSSVIEEKHGYLIMKTIENVTNNEVAIGPASLYTTLKKLLAADLVELNPNTDGNKKVYKITNKGRDMLIKEIQRKKQMIKFAEKFLDLEKENIHEK